MSRYKVDICIYIFFSLFIFSPPHHHNSAVYRVTNTLVYDQRFSTNAHSKTVYIKIWRKPCLIYNFTRKAYTVKYIIASRAKRYISHTITSYDYIAQHPYDLRVDDTVDNKRHEVFFFLFFKHTLCVNNNAIQQIRHSPFIKFVEIVTIVYIEILNPFHRIFPFFLASTNLSRSIISRPSGKIIEFEKYPRPPFSRNHHSGQNNGFTSLI